MIGRRAAKAIAEAYSQIYVSPVSIRRTSGSGKKADFFKDELYDFLYVNDFAPWLMNSIKGLSTFYNARALTEYIMGLHTVDSIVKQTPDWTPKQRSTLGQRVLRELAEALIRSRHGASEPADYDTEERGQVDAMQAALELDGYVYRAGILYVPEESVLDEQEEAGVLESLFTRAQLPDIPTISHHLHLSSEHYHAERWDDSISNSRKVLEGVLQQIASRHARDVAKTPLDDAELDRAVVVRDYLEKVGLLDRKEKEAIAKTYGLLSDAGGHPHIAGKDQARLMRHLALTYSQFALLGFLSSKA